MNRAVGDGGDVLVGVIRLRPTRPVGWRATFTVGPADREPDEVAVWALSRRRAVHKANRARNAALLDALSG